MPSKGTSAKVRLACTYCSSVFFRYPSNIGKGRSYCKRVCQHADSKIKVSLSERIWASINKDGPTQPHCLERGPCWIWTGAINEKGYGTLNVDCRSFRAHRLTWEEIVGPIPGDLPLLHHCDNRPCVRADPAISHLFPGTRGDNVADMVSKGRQATGDRHGSRTKPERRARGDRAGARTHPESVLRGADHWANKMPERIKRGSQIYNARLTDPLVRKLRRRYVGGGVTYKSLSAEYGPHWGTIAKAIHGTTWKHVIDPPPVPPRRPAGTDN